LGLVSPYAFNYHRNKSDHAFHGLAFANFNTADDAQTAVDKLNNYELDRRRLRVELKKRLPAEEEQRQRLGRQSNQQLTHQMTPSTTAAQSVEARLTALDILNPALQPRIIYREPPTLIPQTGNTSFRLY
jgi:RNA recognition motif-containing protein